VRIVDENDQDVPVGVVGEVISRSDAVMAGYLDMPEETERALRGGWFRAGDLARRDEQGYLYIAGRAKDMIIRGGENIYPVEIETVLSRLPGVEQAAVVGVPDERWGEVVAAVLTVSDDFTSTDDEVRAHCRTRLAAYKVPEIIRIVPEMPLNASGKILKRELRRALVT
jgi:acyl-CoA synthetase (AMP-forming)/AMP-acid ligase II